MDPISEMIACLRSWEPETRVLGNVQAGPAADALEALRARVADLESALREADRYRDALEEIIVNETAYDRGDALSAYIAKTALGIP